MSKKKIPVAILGATGSVGQRFIELLANHPWFEIAAVAASERSAGKRYAECVNWMLPTPMPKAVADMPVVPCAPGIPGEIFFSALDSSVAGEIESSFANAGHLVVSNAKNHRMHPDVPLLIPEINADHLALLGRGKIVTNPNCSAIGLCLALKPLYDAFGIEAVHVVTMQAVSGAGYPGISSIDIMDNVVPHISGEEEKLETEPLKIFGKVQGGRIEPAKFRVSAHCNRVAVTDGHTKCVSVKLSHKASMHDIINAWKSFKGAPQRLMLPSAPEFPIIYHDSEASPQPRLHRESGNGMAVSVGRLRECPLFDIKFVVLSHNTIRGAAGGAVLCAELIQRYEAEH